MTVIKSIKIKPNKIITVLLLLVLLTVNLSPLAVFAADDDSTTEATAESDKTVSVNEPDTAYNKYILYHDDYSDTGYFTYFPTLVDNWSDTYTPCEVNTLLEDLNDKSSTAYGGTDESDDTHTQAYNNFVSEFETWGGSIEKLTSDNYDIYFFAFQIMKTDGSLYDDLSIHVVVAEKGTTLCLGMSDTNNQTLDGLYAENIYCGSSFMIYADKDFFYFNIGNTDVDRLTYSHLIRSQDTAAFSTSLVPNMSVYYDSDFLVTDTYYGYPMVATNMPVVLDKLNSHDNVKAFLNGDTTMAANKQKLGADSFKWDTFDCTLSPDTYTDLSGDTYYNYLNTAQYTYTCQDMINNPQDYEIRVKISATVVYTVDNIIGSQKSTAVGYKSFSLSDYPNGFSENLGDVNVVFDDLSSFSVNLNKFFEALSNLKIKAGDDEISLGLAHFNMDASSSYINATYYLRHRYARFEGIVSGDSDGATTGTYYTWEVSSKTASYRWDMQTYTKEDLTPYTETTAEGEYGDKEVKDITVKDADGNTITYINTDNSVDNSQHTTTETTTENTETTTENTESTTEDTQSTTEDTESPSGGGGSGGDGSGGSGGGGSGTSTESTEDSNTKTFGDIISDTKDALDGSGDSIWSLSQLFQGLIPTKIWTIIIATVSFTAVIIIIGVIIKILT